MSDFSKLPQDELAKNLKERYIGLYFEQGVPILDRDLNLLHDLIATTVRSIVTQYIGSGVAAGRKGFEIKAIPTDNDFLIAAGDQPPGTCLVGGIELFIDKDVLYSEQEGVPKLTTPTAADNDPRGRRVDTVYLDVSLTTVDGDQDDSLRNLDDIGIQTSVRVRPAWTVRVAERETTPPAPLPGHTHYPLARLDRRTDQAPVRAEMITDLRQTRLNLDHVERRVRSIERLVTEPALGPRRKQFDPPTVAPDGQLKIFGRNLDLAPVTVQIGGFRAVPVAGGIKSDELRVVVPAEAAGRVKVKVTTGGGTVESDDELKIIGSGPPPVFADPPNEFSPKAGGAGVSVNLFGSNFDIAPVSVDFGDVPATDVTPGPGQIVAKVPSGVTGPVRITVTTGSDTVTSQDSFRGGSPPVFAATMPIDPTFAGVGGTVVLSGDNFDVEPVTVDFGTVRVQPFSVSRQKIHVAVPPDAPTLCKITVTTGIGAVTSATELVVVGS